MHVHVHSADGEAKFWIEPMVALATYTGLSKKATQGIAEVSRGERRCHPQRLDNPLWKSRTLVSTGFGSTGMLESSFYLMNAILGFRDAKVKDILEVQLETPTHLYWPALDVDLSLSILEAPEKYPLVSS